MGLVLSEWIWEGEDMYVSYDIDCLRRTCGPTTRGTFCCRSWSGCRDPEESD